MRLQIINSNSMGNAYILENDQEALLIECGVRFDRIKKALGFNVAKVVGCLLTHEHQDHGKAVVDVMAAGIDVFSSAGTHGQLDTLRSHRAKVVSAGEQFMVGSFKILAFEVKHDCAGPLGYLINHPETGNVLFLTDSYYCEYTFRNLHNVIIEANYCQQIIDNKPGFLRDRIIESHMSLATCKETLAANDLSQVNNIVLIHLSDSNSDARRFKREIEEVTGKVVHVAEPGLIIENFNKYPF